MLTHPVFLSLLVLLAAHVVRDRRDADAVGRLPVDHVELEPRVPLLLPGQQGVLRAPRRVGGVAVLQELVEQLVLDGAAVVGAEETLVCTEFPIPSFVRFRHVLFWEFPCPPWAVASCSSGLQAGGTP